MSDEKVTANPGFAFGQLARALQAPGAGNKAASWAKVLAGMLDGSLAIGSRAPAAGIPAWATLRVLKGGFSSGEPLAGGKLLDHEHARLAALGFPPGAERAVLNASFLTEVGLAELDALLESGRYRINVPEEGALLVVAWLTRHGRAETARSVLAELAPFFDRLRFYPVPHDAPLAVTTRVRVQDVADTVRQLGDVTQRAEMETLRQSVRIWTPLYDRLVSLFAETVVDGWPCQRYSEDWSDRMQALLGEIAQARQQSTRCRWPNNPHQNFRRLTELAAKEPRSLTGREVGRIRAILQAIEAKRGLPGSERCNALRAFQAAQADALTRRELAQELIVRLAPLPADQGIGDPTEFLSPVGAREIPESLSKKLLRAVDAPLAELVQQQVVTSSEMIARLIPALTAQARALAIADPALRRLYSALYQAFRRRRSYLLLNLESQVKLAELPWVRAIEDLRSATADAADATRQVFREVATIALGAFPHAPFPNKLLQEFVALAQAAKLELPLVEELAADIFMGEFTGKFLDAAKLAAELLQGSVYERYYDVPFAELRTLDDVSRGFSKLCTERGAPGAAGRGYVARNGTIIEQALVMTSHNLAGIFQALGLREALAADLPAMARGCVDFINQRVRSGLDLRGLKKCAYAWRQAIFFVSLLPLEHQREFAVWCRRACALQPPIERLEQSIEHRPLTGRPFLGWTVGKHWLFAPTG